MYWADFEDRFSAAEYYFAQQQKTGLTWKA